jgi:hypothetical protein
MKFEPKHWLVIALMVGGFATQLSGIKTGWYEVLTPPFVAGLLANVAATITAIFIGAPGAAADLNHARRQADTAIAALAETEKR